MKSSDYIVDFLVKKNIKHVFGYQGTMIAHFVDSVCKDARIENHICYNEQGAGFAAVGYAKATGKTAVAYATSGPGASNLISAIADAYFDSAPVVFITGQLNTYEYLNIDGLRQNGFQEMDVVSTAQSVTKYCVKITDIADLRYCLEKAFYVAENGRPGPVLIDLPMDMQRQEVEHESMRSFEPEENCGYDADNDAIAKDILDRLNRSNAPVLLIGNGIVYGSETHEKVLAFAKKLNIPVITSMLGRDLMTYDDPINMGHIGGGYGHRYSNIIAHKKADLILALGCSLCKRQTTAKTELFASGADIIRVDIDPLELARKVHKDEVSFLADCTAVIDSLNRLAGENGKAHDAWLQKCQKIKEMLTAFDNSCDERKPNRTMEILSSTIGKNAVICCDVGQHQVWTSQSFHIKEGQQLLFSGGHGAMGFALPAAIGAYYATGCRPIAICGDGAMQMNIQELQWVVREQIPITIFVLNNNSLGLIVQQQDDMLNSFYAASVKEGGFTSPDFSQVAAAYGIDSVKITNDDEFETIMNSADIERPLLVEVMLDSGYRAYPKTYFGEEMHNQRPYIPEELMKEILEM
ncbi:MAG: thiamine pyrophosphate-binding protein [Lachnospiraceae bacterium]|nr:thiamine pyrophosphate-binding protein [Lachnospiraceae bacterium]